MYRNNFNLGDENMDITLIFKVAGVGILISVLNMILTKVDRGDWTSIYSIQLEQCLNYIKGYLI